MTIYYSKTKDDVPAYRVVGFEVQPKSIHHGSYDKHDPSDVPETCFKPTESQGIDPNAESQTITFTYEVSWVVLYFLFLPISRLDSEKSLLYVQTGKQRALVDLSLGCLLEDDRHADPLVFHS